MKLLGEGRLKRKKGRQKIGENFCRSGVGEGLSQACAGIGLSTSVGSLPPERTSESHSVGMVRLDKRGLLCISDDLVKKKQPHQSDTNDIVTLITLRSIAPPLASLTFNRP